jgi:D-glycero-alpha-D-manno-heptose 1-phosphate guanylyltransferase
MEKIKEAIILAGGLGTRLKSVVSDLPKCMAPVCGRPFLFYVINYLRSQGIEKFIFSLGYKHEMIEEYLRQQFSTLNYTCSIEREPLGTGGAILAACYKTTEENVLVLNGDTLFKVSLQEAAAFHFSKKSTGSILLKPVKNVDRYGEVELHEDGSVKSFREKKFIDSGFINGGVYILHVPGFLEEELPEKFSIERDYLENYFDTKKIYGLPQDAYFIDIGIPEDYRQAQLDLQISPLDLKNVTKDWTLFLDRDGVINNEKKGDYIRNPQEFIFYEGGKEALKTFAGRFGKIIVVSNQRGVGRQLMTEQDLEEIHTKMRTEIQSSGGNIDEVYYCTAVEGSHPDRKPNPGMAFRARHDFPEIDFTKSIMAGNKPSDMLFGKNAGMYTVYLATTHPETPFPHPDIDLRFNSLAELAKAL